MRLALFTNSLRVHRDALSISTIGSHIMRGLEIRVSFALTRIAAIADPENTDMLEVEFDAECQGRYDYRRGFGLPILFEDERILRNAWKRGWADAAFSDELDNCPHCIAAHGDPCPIHG
ncbi:MAG: hypothetical protein VB138_08565 [Burkholderia sp.]